MSWTIWPHVAEKFADLWVKQDQAKKPGHVYKAVVPPACVLAGIRGKLQKIRLPDGTEREVPVGTEMEFVVDARSIPIVLVETASDRLDRVQREEAKYAARFVRAMRGSN